ncbi:HoxN/HupN/NixA family nickel/cobalt transporter [Amycolatopsis sacchari]|uniref:Nickel/cobalt efflux system n=1 Tax=Amycolatopsis sacchari TaxID=115433 RepID=A0A1I3M2L6_9PSEU|nr:high-affinity nickel-transport protein [Amycolatopsis sacchari]
MRHAFDADHISAIDNTTRKLMQQGQRPLSVGFFFALGHSSVVFGLALLLSPGVGAVIGPVRDGNSAPHHYTSLIGTSVSGTFLLLIAAVNVGILKVLRGLRSGADDEAALEQELANRGLLNRLLGRFPKAIGKPWHMYPLGLLFGLGFDTATEVALLVLADSATVAGLSVAVVVVIGAAELLSVLSGEFGRSGAFRSPDRPS